jgi:hypothetical protein
MEYRICKKCGVEKELSSEFFHKSKNGLKSECKVCCAIYAKKWRENNEKEIKEYNKEYKADNKEKIKVYNKQYKIDHKKESNEQLKIKRKNNPIFRLRQLISTAVFCALKRKNNTKNGSILKFLPYHISQLKEHLENQFERWMTWNNQGKYDPKIWDDNDPATWTWNMDHIIPHSTFNYTSMEDENFQKCWALENLRPLSAKQNILDGIRNIN